MAKSPVLKELSYLAADTPLKVGAKSNYFYCGTVGDFIDHIDEYNYFAAKRADASLTRAKKLLKNALEAEPSPADYAKSILEDNAFSVDPSADGYLSYLGDYFKSLKKLTERCRTAKRAKDGFRDLKYREIKRFEKSTVEPDCYVLILSGEENGGYWMTTDARDSCLSFGKDGLDDE